MRTILDRIRESRWKDALLPLSFLFGNLLNFAFYYLGLAYKDNPVRTYGFIIGQLLFAVLCGLTLLAALKNIKPSKRSWLCLSAVLLLYLANFAVGFGRFGLHAGVVDYFIRFICFALPAFFAGICGALFHSEQQLLPLMERISFFVLPAGLIYSNGVLFNCNPFWEGRNLGIMDYMFFSYTIMPFLLVHIIRFSDKEELELPIVHRNAAHPQIIRVFLIAVYWVGIIGSGTRGTYICVAGFCILFVLSRLLHREPVKGAALVSVAMLALLLFNVFVYAPPGMYGVGRLDMFIDGLMRGQIVTSLADSENIQELLDALVNADGGKLVLTGDLVIRNRGTLYKLAWKEFLKSPLTGMGLGGYSIKYGMYPHNVILELLCEGGLLLGVPILAFVLLALLRLLKAGRVSRETRCLLLLFMAYAIRYNISGCAWGCDVLLCAIGYGLAIKLYHEGEKKPAAAEAENMNVTARKTT